ncbi:MAG TPA: lipocalin family protein [Pyrinomonadaceae bacterium]|nr:lipocalin family protein [Pyrinomonadaceae bacterium]
MIFIKIKLAILLSLLLMSWSGNMDKERKPLTVVPSVDLGKYVGKWYEIARLPNRFENKCVSSVTATYALRPDGQIDVLNECKKASGKLKKAKGKAKVVDKKSNAKLKVTFFWPFYGDYWILELGANYEYAVVGEESRKYLWILSRTPQIDETFYQELLARMANQGFDTSRIIKTPQP